MSFHTPEKKRKSMLNEEPSSTSRSLPDKQMDDLVNELESESTDGALKWSTSYILYTDKAWGWNRNR